MLVHMDNIGDGMFLERPVGIFPARIIREVTFPAIPITLARTLRTVIRTPPRAVNKDMGAVAHLLVAFCCTETRYIRIILAFV